jgi:energy-coupling factor transporter transmembrane protein EcfT
LSRLWQPSVAARVLVSLLAVVGIATAPLGSTPSALCAVAVVLGLLAWTRPEPRLLMRRGIWPLLGIIALALPIAFAEPERAGSLAARAVLAVTAALAIGSTIPSSRLGSALAALGVPASLAAVIATVLRQVDLLVVEGRRLSLARSLRGARGASASVDTLATLLARSAARAERVELAMRLRGYAIDRSRPGVSLALRDMPLLMIAAAASVAIHFVA